MVLEVVDMKGADVAEVEVEEHSRSPHSHIPGDDAICADDSALLLLEMKSYSVDSFAASPVRDKI